MQKVPKQVKFVYTRGRKIYCFQRLLHAINSKSKEITAVIFPLFLQASRVSIVSCIFN